MRPFLEELDQRVLVCDGAMGTMLYAKGAFLNRSFEELNLTQPDLVAAVHLDYVRAGSDVIETNTFGANRVKLSGFGLAEQLHAINAQGARIARHATRDAAYVAGAIGPLGIRIEPWGRTGVDEAESIFQEQAQALVDGGVDLFVLETFRDLNEISAAVRAVRRVCALPIVAQMTTDEDGATLDGAPPEAFAPALEQLGVDIVGVNCSVGPAPMLETIQRMARAVRIRLSALPNAGRPRDVDGRNLYLCSPDYMASYARRFIASGVKLVGGCCGTTPDHIRVIKAAVTTSAAAAQTARRAGVASSAAAAAVPESPLAAGVTPAEKSRLSNAISRGKFVVAVSLVPPKGHDAAATVNRARALKIRGVDVVQVVDLPRAHPRMSAIAVAVLIERQAGVETILHYPCRTKRLLSMQSELLGAHAMGLRNLLIVTGEPLRDGPYPDATSISDVDSIGLTNVATRLNHGLDIGGQSIGSPTGFLLGVEANPSAVSLDEEVRRFEYKVEAGAEFAITPPLFDLRDLEVFQRRIEHVKIPLIVSLWPFESALNAEFMANEVPGVRVPAALLDRMRRAGCADAEAAEGIAIARELAARMRGAVQGMQAAAPSGNIDAAFAVIDAIG